MGRACPWGRAFALLVALLACFALLAGCAGASGEAGFEPATPSGTHQGVRGASPSAPDAAASFEYVHEAPDFSGVPDYFGEDYIELNGGAPGFTEADLAAPEGTEVYGELDELGRATYAFARLCANTRPAPGSHRNTNMPDPSGFVQAFYPEAGIDHLYERSHLIAYSLNDEAVNPRDLICGTQHLNQSTMRDFEEAVRAGIDVVDEETGQESHVLMRVTPDFRDGELVARGVQIEALSMEDAGGAVRLNVYCYNVQPGVAIDYATGESRLADAADAADAGAAGGVGATPLAGHHEEAHGRCGQGNKVQAYVLNTSTMRYHEPGCASVAAMRPENRRDVEATAEDLAAQGYAPCGRCR